MNNSILNPLFYKDTKPVGAADFYFAINATFRFILKRFGIEGLRKSWKDLGYHYFAPVSVAWKKYGLQGVASYWKAFFQAGRTFQETKMFDCARNGILRISL